jgi:hypothetical protein
MKYWIKFLFLIYLVNIQAHWSNYPIQNIPICTTTNNQRWQQIVSDGNYAAIITMQYYRSCNWDNYTSRVVTSGYLCESTSIRFNDVAKMPVNFKLQQNYATTLNPSTVISYKLQVSGHITIKAYEVAVNEIAILMDESKPAVNYEVGID